MADYYVGSGTDTSPFDTWAKAATWLGNIAHPLTAADTVYIASNHEDAHDYSANELISAVGGVSTPVVVISVTDATTNYAKATANQINTYQDAGSNYILFSENWAFYGVQMSSKGIIYFDGNTDTSQYFEDCTLKVGSGSSITFLDSGKYNFKDCAFDFTNDSGASANKAFSLGYGNIVIEGGSIANGSNRTGNIFADFTTGGTARISGLDCTSLTNATTPELFGYSTGVRSQILFENCKMAATHVLYDYNTVIKTGSVTMVNCSAGDNPTQFLYASKEGHLRDSTVTRTGGPEVQGIAFSWGGETATTGIVTTAACSASSPLITPWINTNIATAGTYDVAVYIQNTNSDFNELQVWLEVQYQDDATSQFYTLASDREPTITGTPSSQTDDTGSTWSTSYTYHQKLEIQGLTVGTKGIMRGRVLIGLASIAGTRHFYISPKLVVTDG